MTYAGNAGDVWAVADYVSDVRMNAKTIAVMTGAAIAALDITPTSRYDFEGDGNDVVGSNNLTATGSPTYTEGGPFGEYVTLNGSSQYFQASANTAFDVTTGDFSVWGYIKLATTGAFQEIVSKRGTGNVGYEIFVSSVNQLSAYIHASSDKTAIVTTALTTGKWYFFAASYARSGNLVVYLYDMSTGAYDTATTNISSESASITNTQKFEVGRRGDLTNNYFNGNIDHLNVLIGTAITSTQVLILIGSLRPGMTVKCSKSENGFVKENLYQRNIEGTQWKPVGTFRGSGSDIAALITNNMTYPGLLAFCTSTGSGYTAGTMYKMNNSGTFEGLVDSSTITSPTISGPTLSGTVAGTPTFSGNFATSGTPKLDNAGDIKVISAPSDPSSGYNRIYGKAIDANNDGLFVKKKRSSSVIEVQLDRAPFYHQNPTEQSTTASVMTKIKESTLNITPKNGVLYISFQGKCGSSTSTFQIYRNGSAIGTSRNTFSTTYTTWTEAISAAWAVNDTVQIYASNTIGSNSYAQNLIIYEGTDGATANS